MSKVLNTIITIKIWMNTVRLIPQAYTLQSCKTLELHEKYIIIMWNYAAYT